MDDYQIVKDDYFYLKEKAFKAIRKLGTTQKITNVKENPEDSSQKELGKKTNQSNKPQTTSNEKTIVKQREIHCPLEGEELITLNLKEINIDYCPQCHGLWLDLGELERLLEKDLKNSAIFHNQLIQPLQDHEEQKLKCPVCHVKLKKHKEYNAGITDDICPVCGGIWLDSGEFAALYLEKRQAESASQILKNILGKYVDLMA